MFQIDTHCPICMSTQQSHLTDPSSHNAVLCDVTVCIIRMRPHNQARQDSCRSNQSINQSTFMYKVHTAKKASQRVFICFGRKYRNKVFCVSFCVSFETVSPYIHSLLKYERDETRAGRLSLSVITIHYFTLRRAAQRCGK